MQSNIKQLPVLFMADGGIWHKAKNPPYKHANLAYDTTMTGISSQNTYGGFQKIRHATLPWKCLGCHLTTVTTYKGKRHIPSHHTDNFGIHSIKSIKHIIVIEENLQSSKNFLKQQKKKP
jgi:hypothetical protein